MTTMGYMCLGSFVLGIVFLIAWVVCAVLMRDKQAKAFMCGLFIAGAAVCFVLFYFLGPGSAQSTAGDKVTATPEPTETAENVVDESVTFEEIYQAYKENELRADDTYQYNRYRITAVINNIETDGLFNLTGGATLTMEKMVGNTYVFFYAEFEKEQEEALKAVNTGDTITFEGKCLDAGTWTECKLITE